MTAMSRATRRVVVAHLAERGMNVADMASELGVSRETVRRDLCKPPPPTAPEDAADARPGEEALSLPASLQLGKDLRILAASYKAPAEEVARQLLHQEAEVIRARVHARFAATAAT